MINFKSPELSDRAAAANAVADSGYTGSDASFANIFLLRQKYGTQIALQDGLLFRYYNGQGSRRGYAFPLGTGEPQAALKLIAEDARQSGRPLEFCLVDEPRAQILREYFKTAGSNGAEPPLHFTENRGDSDYIYSAESLATLAGNQYKKKRNHVSRFNRTYSNYEIRPLTPENFADVLTVEKSWLNIETLGESSDTDCECTCECREAAWAERSEDEKSRLSEYCAIREALENFDALGMKGAVLYVEGKPVGMTMASEIVPGAWDIHFEKVIDEYAENGGYAIINKLFAERLVAAGAKFINREEDINIEGLRKAKLSYYPQTILDKTHAVVDGETLSSHPRDLNCHPRDLNCHPREGGDLPD
ncbi:phosphatidylglycerol lysyltransferase domain-containing protein [Fibrobacter sp.]|uniref:DUF2156 domain-containing protein n=1 Tax=Fibrobacter sp. TaxID=35828 RepID=UPI0025B87E09|nr:phosphatidylglycerol lysyltransferase domain-containing protein [Fibrobacter sp.]MBR4006840.1 DUF2156 domain-containing protein [Fibrobacter sp.]